MRGLVKTALVGHCGLGLAKALFGQHFLGGGGPGVWGSIANSWCGVAAMCLYKPLSDGERIFAIVRHALPGEHVLENTGAVCPLLHRNGGQERHLVGRQGPPERAFVFDGRAVHFSVQAFAKKIVSMAVHSPYRTKFPPGKTLYIYIYIYIHKYMN